MTVDSPEPQEGRKSRFLQLNTQADRSGSERDRERDNSDRERERGERIKGNFFVKFFTLVLKKKNVIFFAN